VTVLSRDKKEVSRGVGRNGECMKMGLKCLERMTLKSTLKADNDDDDITDLRDRKGIVTCFRNDL